jgi:hypothetical protein
MNKRWEKFLEHFCGLGMRVLIIFSNKKNEDYNFHAINHIMNIATLLICLLPLVQNYTICLKTFLIGQILIKLNISCMG